MVLQIREDKNSLPRKLSASTIVTTNTERQIKHYKEGVDLDGVYVVAILPCLIWAIFLQISQTA